MRFLITALLGVLLACAEPAEEAGPAELAPAEIAGEVPSERASTTGRTSDWPALATSTDGSLWMAYVEWDGDSSDSVVVRHRDPSGAWNDPTILNDGNWDHYFPAIVAVPGGAMAFWSGGTGGSFDLFAASIRASGETGPIERIAAGEHSDFHVRAAADPDGNVTVAWQSFRDLQGEIYARRRTTGGWGPEVRISDSAANDWEPAIALDGSGTAWIAWDSYHAGNYDVYLASFDGQARGEPVAITSGPAAEFHSDVAVDPTDRVWLVFDTLPSVRGG